VLKVRGGAASRLVPPSNEIVHLPGDLSVAVLVPDTEDVLEQIDDWQVGNVASVRNAVPLNPGHVLPAQPAAQLEEQPGLADARLSRDKYYLAGTPVGRLQGPF
jgi:hypothetical protein